MLPKYTIRVTSGFEITSRAYFDFIKENDLKRKISHLLGTVDYSDEKSLIKAAKNIKKTITEGDMPKKLIEEILKEYSLLSGVFQDAKVNLKLKNNDRIYKVKGEAMLFHSIEELWASLFHYQNIKDLKDLNIRNLGENLEITVEKADHKSQIVNINTGDQPILTATKVYVCLDEADLASATAKRQVDGVLFNSAKNIKAETLTKFANTFSPRPVIYHTSSVNFKAELETIKKIRHKLDLKNLWIILPLIRTMQELVETKQIINKIGLYRSPSFKIFMNIKIPSNVILIDKFIEAGIDGIFIDSNHLTSSILGIEENNDELIINSKNEAVLWTIEKVVKTAQKYHIPSILSNFSTSTLEHLIKLGITSVCVSSGEIERKRGEIAWIEGRILHGKN